MMKKRNRLPSVLLLICGLLLASVELCSGETLSTIEKERELALKNIREYSFIKIKSNMIAGGEVLNSFFEKMQKLNRQHDHIINIVHIGDSHIQAGMMTEEIRILLQKSFGNAGRGLIFPHRMARSNEPNSIESTSVGDWRQISVISKHRESEPGIASRVVFTTDSTAEFSILVKDNEFLKYAFNRVKIFAPRDEQYFDFELSNDFGEIIAGAQATDSNFVFQNLCNNFSLKINKLKDTQGEFRLNGIVLQNDSANGVLYHSIGTNGAHFCEYNTAPDFFTQLPELQPDLIIVSLGANEGAARDITAGKVYADAVQMIENLRNVCPETPILLTVPVHNYYRKKYFNRRIKLIQNGLQRAAAKTNCALLDLYEAGGGDASCQKWKARGLFRPDGVHFTQKGYQLQGDLIFTAIIDSYTKYVEKY